MSRDYAQLRGISAYEVLGVTEHADAEEIRLAHRRLIARIHPDHAGSALFAQLVNDAKHVLMNERSDYDAWRQATAAARQASTAAPDPWDHAPTNRQGWTQQHQTGPPGPLQPHYVATDGRPGYFVPPGAIPVPPRLPLPHERTNGQPGNLPQGSAAPRRGAPPQVLTGRMRELAEQAQRDLFRIFGAATSEVQRQTYIRTANLLAALRIYRDLVAAAFTDDLISAGLGDKPAHFLSQFVHNYRQAPPSAERDQAISVITDVDKSTDAGVLVAMVRLTIEKHAGRA